MNKQLFIIMIHFAGIFSEMISLITTMAPAWLKESPQGQYSLYCALGL